MKKSTKGRTCVAKKRFRKTKITIFIVYIIILVFYGLFVFQTFQTKQAGEDFHVFGNYLYADVSRALKAADNRIVLVIGTQNKKADTLIREYRAIQPHLVIEPISESKLLPQLENEGEMLELLYTF